MVWASLLSSSPEPTSHRLLVFKYRVLDLYLQCVWIHRGLKCPCKNGSHYWRSCHCAILYNYQGWRHSSGHIVSGTRLKGKQSSPREPLAAPKCSTRHCHSLLGNNPQSTWQCFWKPHRKCNGCVLQPRGDLLWEKVNPTVTDQQMWNPWKANECKTPRVSLTKQNKDCSALYRVHKQRSFPYSAQPFHWGDRKSPWREGHGHVCLKLDKAFLG